VSNDVAGKMCSLRLANRQLAYSSNTPIPSPGPQDALVRVNYAGICGTDLALLKGYYPFQGILGHEFVGTVQRGPPAWQGKRVVGEINIGCDHCEFCALGEKTHCINRRVLGIKGCDGAFAEFLVLPIENLHEVPESVKDEAAVFTEPLAAALQIQEQIEIKPAVDWRA